MKKRKATGFSRGDLCAFVALFCLLVIIALVLYPVFAGQKTKSNRSTCASNEKQIGLAILGYAMDYDGHFPPAAQKTTGANNSANGVLSGWAVTHNAQGTAVIAPNAQGKTDAEKAFAFSPLGVYMKNAAVFHCPAAPKNSGPLSYMMNDLASGADIAQIRATAEVVLVCDGEDFGGSVGHAFDPSAPPAPAAFSPTGAVVLGATLQTAPTRHNGGANYLFADGRTEWLKPEQVFFPSRWKNSPFHKSPQTGEVFGFAPDGERRFAGKLYEATFHLR